MFNKFIFVLGIIVVLGLVFITLANLITLAHLLWPEVFDAIDDAVYRKENERKNKK